MISIAYSLLFSLFSVHISRAKVSNRLYIVLKTIVLVSIGTLFEIMLSGAWYSLAALLICRVISIYPLSSTVALKYLNSFTCSLFFFLHWYWCLPALFALLSPLPWLFLHSLLCCVSLIHYSIHSLGFEGFSMHLLAVPHYLRVLLYFHLSLKAFPLSIYHAHWFCTFIAVTASSLVSSIDSSGSPFLPYTLLGLQS